MNTSTRAGDQSPVLLAPDTPVRRRRRVNGWELALWILGIALLTAAAEFEVQFIAVVIKESNPETVSNDIGFSQAFYQAATLMIPGFVSAGFVCIALAIFLRALDANARRRTEAAVVEPIPVAAVPLAGVTIAPASTSVPAPVAEPSVPTTPTDYAAFMRPSEEPDDEPDPEPDPASK